ncbi:MAG: imidazole glycerol phosphate synthase subunit HisH [Rubrivivax sp.]|nr:imidazole glycerol phosphate synthase subunit HisH [Rubrivivax sp.]
MIAIIDYKVGNLGSIRNMFKKIGIDSAITDDAATIAAAPRLVLPGVGAFDRGMEALHDSGLIPLLERRVLAERVPILGICLGMQLMARRSEEGARPGLGWIDAEVVRFRPADAALKVPHMGWNRIVPTRECALMRNLPEQPRFYFVHSYHVRCRDDDDVIATTPYGETFHSAFHRANVWGVQFHPEKSHKFGMGLLRNFAAWSPAC